MLSESPEGIVWSITPILLPTLQLFERSVIMVSDWSVIVASDWSVIVASDWSVIVASDWSVIMASDPLITYRHTVYVTAVGKV